MDEWNDNDNKLPTLSQFLGFSVVAVLCATVSSLVLYAFFALLGL